MDITLYNVPPYLCNTIKNNLSTIIKKYLIKNEIDTSNPKTYMKIQKIPSFTNEKIFIQNLISANIKIYKDSIHKEDFCPPNQNHTYDLTFQFAPANNLLIVGNGFDLEHGLKTHYTDFFETINNRVSSKNEIILNNHKYLIEDNHLLLYLLEEYKQNKLQGNNWIDIETELKKIISLIDEINTNNFIDNMSYYSGDEYTTIKKIQSKSSYYFKNCLFPFIIGNNYYKYINEHYNISIKILEKDLNELTNMLRDYLLEQDISVLCQMLG